MKVVCGLILLLSLLLLPLHQGEAWTHGSVASITCSPSDGSCSPSNAAVQHSNFFTGYAGTTYATRPGWNVAGVDYAVGQNSNGAALADPLTASVPSGWTRSTVNQTYTCSGANPATLSGMDFSLEGGWQILDNASCSGNVLITNIKMAVGSFADTHFFEFMKFTAGSENVTISYSTFDGNGCNFTAQAGAMIWQVNNASLTFQYNWLLNTPDQGIIMNNTGGSTTSVTIQYNLFDVVGYSSGSHNQFLAFGNPPSATVWASSVSTYNTVFMPAAPGYVAPALGLCPGGALTGGLTGAFYHSPGNGTNGTINAVTANNNTIASPLGAGSQNGFLIRAEGPGPVGTYTVQNNYMDNRGTFGYFTSSSVTGTKTCSGNKDLVAGGAITGTVGGMTCS